MSRGLGDVYKRQVQAMVGRNATQEQVETYLLEQLDSGKINTAGAATIMQALGI